jgi:hypothetical protein
VGPMPMLSATTSRPVLLLLKALPKEREWAAFVAANPALSSEVTKIKHTPRHILNLDAETAVEAVWWVRNEPDVLSAIAGVDSRVIVAEALKPHLKASGVVAVKKSNGPSPEERTTRILSKADPERVVEELSRGKSPVVWENVRVWLLGQDEQTRGQAARALVERSLRENENDLAAMLVALSCAGATGWSVSEAIATASKRWRGDWAVYLGISAHGVLDASVLTGIAENPGCYHSSQIRPLPFGPGAVDVLTTHCGVLPASITASAFAGRLLSASVVSAHWARFDTDERALIAGSAPDVEELRVLLPLLDPPRSFWGPGVSLISTLQRFESELTDVERAQLLVHTGDRDAAKWVVAHPEYATQTLFAIWPEERLHTFLDEVLEEGAEAEPVLVAAWSWARGMLSNTRGRFGYRSGHRSEALASWCAARLAAEVEDCDWALVWENISDHELTPAQVVSTAKALRA